VTESFGRFCSLETVASSDSSTVVNGLAQSASTIQKNDYLSLCYCLFHDDLAFKFYGLMYTDIKTNLNRCV